MASSGHPVLREILPDKSISPSGAERMFSSPTYQDRSSSLGDQKYVTQMVPGYAGQLEQFHSGKLF